MRLIAQHPGGVGSPLKEGVSDLAVLTDALGRMRDGESVLDPTIVFRLTTGSKLAQVRRDRYEGPGHEPLIMLGCTFSPES